MFTAVTWIDPVVSLIICAIIVWGTWDLLRETVKLALNAVPENIDAEKVLLKLKYEPGVSEVHDLLI